LEYDDLSSLVGQSNQKIKHEDEKGTLKENMPLMGGEEKPEVAEKW